VVGYGHSNPVRRLYGAWTVRLQRKISSKSKLFRTLPWVAETNTEAAWAKGVFDGYLTATIIANAG